ncbi:MAG TPA: lipid-binding SYLF domain-containing protein [Bryobacteraceae bacterium]|nr:lipid-binding SYLF domain-containing protein [Bryobacteraceae bacterium]
MKYAILTLALTPALLFAARGDEMQRVTDAGEVFQDIMSAPDKGIPQDILNKAQCVGIIPGVKKAGFIVGAKYGKGILVCRTDHGWSAPEVVKVEGGSVGFQIGASETDVVFVVQNRSGEDKLMHDKFTIGGSAAATAGPVGRTASAETDAQLHAEILSYSRSRGLFAGIDLGGATLRPDKDANRDLYGRDVTPQEILTGAVPQPAGATALYTELNRYAGPASARR